MEINSLLQCGRELGASDVHLVAGNVPVLRIHGALTRLTDMPVLTGEDIDGMFETMTDQEQRQRFRRHSELDFSYSIEESGRFRVNVARQLGTTSMVIRVLPPTIPPLESLALPAICRELVFKPHGLIVISGPTGSGKSTTLAAMIDHLNQSREARGRRVVTIEDPVEYLYNSENCLVSQRELGGDTRSFVDGLRHVLRQDPDVILIGEMRDTDTAAAALTIAETGHLVLTTGHAPSTTGAIERVIDLFPPHERPLVQTRLASLLVGVLCQTLVPRADRPGRVAAVEVMLANTAVRNTIREGKLFQLPNIIRTHQQDGMTLMDHALIKLFRTGMISPSDMFAVCHDRDEVQRLIGKVDLETDAAVAGAKPVVAAR